MMQQIMNENDTEEISHMAVNLQLVTLYTYPDYFLIQAHASNSKIRTNLILSRDKPTISAQPKATPPQNYIEKTQYSAFMGILTVLSQSYLFLVQACEKICAIEGQDIFEVKEIALVLCSEEAKGQLKTQIDNYTMYLKKCLLKESYYFSYDYDLSLSRQAYAKGYPTRGSYNWNLNMSVQLLALQDKGWFIGLMQGSVKYFKVFLQGRKVEYILISRRSWKLGGTRYNARGVDSKGHTANFCQTEQMVVVGGYLFSHVQIRGSVPAFWKQSGIYAEVQFYKNHQDNAAAFEKHFREINKVYGEIFCVNLLSKHKSGQSSLTLYYQKLVKELDLPFLRYQFYDFHFACKGQKFQRSDYLIQKLAPVNNYFGYYSQNLTQKTVMSTQRGVFRTNCLDCLDRTNMVQSKIAYQILGVILMRCGFSLPSILDAESILQAVKGIERANMFVMNLKNGWADKGDSISKHYTGTGSTHTNVTRTGRRDLKGSIDHGFKTLGRFYKQYMEDNYKQEVIDLLVGRHTPTINLSQFENRLKNAKEEELDSPQFVQL